MTRLIERTPSAYPYPLLIKQMLHTPISYAPDQEIVYSRLVRYTYRDLYRRIARLASLLESVGVRQGDTVAVLDWDSHRFLECFLAIPMMGAVLHTVNVRLSPEQVLYTMNHAQDRVVLVHEDFLPMVEGFADRLETVKEFVVITDRETRPSSTVRFAGEYEELLGLGDESYQFPDFDENSQATLFYTTGTTGAPKGVCFSHRHLVLHTLAVGLAVSGFTAPGRFQSGDVYMPLTPMFHVHAWGFPYVATLLGAKQIYPGRFDPESAVRLIQEERVTFSHCVPTVLQMVIESQAAKSADFRGWKVNTGGMNLPRGLAERALDLGIEIFHGYGMSETCPILTLANLKPHMMDWDRQRQLDFRTKTGFPIPLVDLRIVDEEGNEVPRSGRSTARPAAAVNDPIGLGLPRTPIRGRSASGPIAGKDGPTQMPAVDDRCGYTSTGSGDEAGAVDNSSRLEKNSHHGSTGEIVVRAPWLTQGYFRDPERSEELWRGGWLHTGDVAHIDAEGYVQITDRLKDAIKSGGEWISSLELESLISRHPGVSEVAVVGLAHEKWGERPVALVVPKSEYLESPTETELREFLLGFVDSGAISRWTVPDRFLIVDSIPKTSVGKLNKKEIRSRLQADFP